MLMLYEMGRLYPADHLLEMRRLGEELFFKGEKELRDWRIVLALNEFEEEDDD
jgi:hypothetical protein